MSSAGRAAAVMANRLDSRDQAIRRARRERFAESIERWRDRGRSGRDSAESSAHYPLVLCAGILILVVEYPYAGFANVLLD